jgi:hypothetical protein
MTVVVINSSLFAVNKPRGASPGLRWYVKISIGNEFWGPLNQKRGERSAGYGFTIDRARNKSSASHIRYSGHNKISQ